VSASISVSFRAFDGVELNARLYGVGGSRSAVLLLEGSGRIENETEPATWPFDQLARALAARGHMVLRYPKRGSGENLQRGSFWRATFESDLADARSALACLESHAPRSRVHLLGHSYGGPLALRLAAGEGGIRGVGMITSTLRPIDQLLLEQNQKILELSGVPAPRIEAELRSVRELIEGVRKDSYECKAPACQHLDGVAVVDGIQLPWLKEVLSMNFAELATKCDAPLLFVSGGADPIVPDADGDFARDLFAKDGGERRFLRLDDLDHLFTAQVSRSAALEYMRQTQRTQVYAAISTSLVDELDRWIESTMRNRG